MYQWQPGQPTVASSPHPETGATVEVPQPSPVLCLASLHVVAVHPTPTLTYLVDGKQLQFYI